MIINDRRSLGELALQDFRADVDEVMRNSVTACRIEDRDVFGRWRAQGHEGSNNPERSVGDLRGGFLMSPLAGRRKIPAWRFSSGSISIEPSATKLTGSVGGGGPPARQVNTTPVFDDDWRKDDRFRLSASVYPLAPSLPRDQPGLVLDSMKETEQELIYFPAQVPLIAANEDKGANPEIASRVFDLDDEDRLDTGRSALLHTAWRVINLKDGCSYKKGSVLAWQLGLSGIDSKAGWGTCFSFGRVGFTSWFQSGPFDIVKGQAFHLLGKDDKGRDVYPVGIDTLAHYRDGVRDAPIDFGGEKVPTSKFSLLADGRLVHNSERKHDYVCGKAPGFWEVQVEVPFYIKEDHDPKRKPEDEPPPPETPKPKDTPPPPLPFDPFPPFGPQPDPDQGKEAEGGPIGLGLPPETPPLPQDPGGRVIVKPDGSGGIVSPLPVNPADPDLGEDDDSDEDPAELGKDPILNTGLINGDWAPRGFVGEEPEDTRLRIGAESKIPTFASSLRAGGAVLFQAFATCEGQDSLAKGGPVNPLSVQRQALAPDVAALVATGIGDGCWDGFSLIGEQAQGRSNRGPGGLVLLPAGHSCPDELSRIFSGYYDPAGEDHDPETEVSLIIPAKLAAIDFARPSNGHTVSGVTGGRTYNGVRLKQTVNGLELVGLDGEGSVVADQSWALYEGGSVYHKVNDGVTLEMLTSGGVSPTINFKSSQGTIASPTDNDEGDPIGEVSFYCYESSQIELLRIRGVYDEAGEIGHLEFTDLSEGGESTATFSGGSFNCDGSSIGFRRGSAGTTLLTTTSGTGSANQTLQHRSGTIANLDQIGIPFSDDPVYLQTNFNVSFAKAYLIRTSVGAYTMTLPAITTVGTGKIIRISDHEGNAGTNNITLARTGTDTIRGAASYLINSNYGSVTVRAVDDGGTKSWVVIAET